MDRNSLIGIIIIAVLFVAYFQYTKPSKEQLQKIKRQQDSIAQVEARKKAELKKDKPVKSIQDSVAANKIDTTLQSDSIKNIELVNKLGIFAKGGIGEKKYITLENKKLKITFSTLGGKIHSVELKGYKTYDGKPIVLLNGDSTIFGLNFFANNKNITTNNLYFTPSIKANNDTIKVKNSPQTLVMSLNLDNGRKIAYEYTVFPDSFLIDFNIKINNLNKIIANNTSTIMFDWQYKAKQFEKSRTNENRYTTIYYKHYQDDVDNLSYASDDKEEIPTKIKWIAFKQQFFSSIIIAKTSFENTLIEQKNIKKGKYIKDFHANIMLAYPITAPPNYQFKANMLFVPNKFKLLRKYSKNYEKDNDLQLDKILKLGWAIFGWVNKYLIIPIFDFLSSFIHNYGLIILLLTIIIKAMLFPFTYKSYMSSAKMRVLKPQIDEIYKKIPKEKNLERQQAVMALYKKAGVSPMGGCLPMLLQLPILYAMFMFFPTSIELRQQSFLWAKDLSAPDSILDLPFNIPFYGDHVSLFALLMAISMVIYTKMQQNMNPSQSSMPGMKGMMYVMPILFLGFMNNYSAALSYYYFLANLITMLQIYIFNKSVDEKKILAQLEKNKQKPVKKSKFQQRMEEMAKQRGYYPPKKK
jgi:YidC/Oxa1 family membrane protein insertase